MSTNMTRDSGWAGRRRNIEVVAATIDAFNIVLSSVTILLPAFAHSETVLPVIGDHLEVKSITVVVGHSNEPAYGVKPGIHDGEHGLEVLLSDSSTGLPIGNAELKADK